MSMRVQKASENAIEIAKFFSDHDSIDSVVYPGLSSHPQHELAKKQQRSPHNEVLYGSMISVIFKSKTLLESFISKVKLFTLAESLGGVESLLSVPYFMTHADVPVEVKSEMGLVPEMLRFAVGVEHIDDLLDDIAKSLN